MLKKSLITAVCLLVALIVGGFTLAPSIIEKSMNKQVDVSKYQITDQARTLHTSLQITDWHADTLLWERNFLQQSEIGHVDLPRLQSGSIKLQVLTTVTKSPKGQNYESNSASSDSITSLAVAQLWPMRTWSSILERALYQAEKLNGFVEDSGGSLVLIKDREDWQNFLADNNDKTAVMLGTEGLHPLEGNLANLKVMYDAGFRMFGLTHFFDNELGGSLHGIEKDGLTDFGRSVVQEIDSLGGIIDLAHASEKMAWDVLAITDKPVVVSHTGIKGHCNKNRNFPDDLMKAIADKGGLIAVGYWDEAVCGEQPEDIAGAIKYGIELVGADHIALGSDWDGTTTSITADNLITITDALLKAGVSEGDIKKVMQDNSLEFLLKALPTQK